MVKKFLVSYGHRPPYASDIIANMAKFDLVDTGFNLGSGVAEVKTLNPNCKIIGYMDAQMVNPKDDWYQEVTIHEDWFLHDLNGNRLVNRDYGGEYVDESSSDWQTFYANKVLSKCQEFGFDGVFVDDVNMFTEWHRNNRFTVDGSLVPDYVITGSYDRMMSFIKAVRAKLAGKLMIINPNNLDFADYADGYLIEDFMNPSWYQTPENLFAKPNKIKVCHSKTVSPDFSFACALMGDNVYWGYATTYWETGDAYKGYPPQMDIVEGRPIGAYTIENNVYKRTFEHLKVTADLNTQTGTLTFEETPYPTPTPPILATFSLAGLGTLIGYALKPEAPIIPMLVGAVAGGITGLLIDRTIRS